MACRKTPMKFNERLLDIRFGGLVALILVVLSVLFWDLPLAAWIAKYLLAYFPHVKNNDIPDLLLITVVILTSLSWMMYFYLVHKNIHDRRTHFFRVMGTVMPLTFVVKDVLKWIFGRTNTRIWLSHPSLHGFHWFAGAKGFEGFPSGHMLVFTPLFLALWQFFPRYRLYYGVAWLCLAIALIVTEYHFLSDVLAGAFVGAVVYLTVIRAVRS
jgi:membrane-associated phospholipid phosphatase